MQNLVFLIFFLLTISGHAVIKLDAGRCGPSLEYEDCIKCCVSEDLLKDKFEGNSTFKTVYCGTPKGIIKPADWVISESELSKLPEWQRKAICNQEGKQIEIRDGVPITIDGCRLSCLEVKKKKEQEKNN